jgi:cytochrome bd-type quinol oxidase subunit 2
VGEPEVGAPKRTTGFLSLPSTGVGKWSAWLLLVSIVLVLLNNLVVMPHTEQRTSLELAQRAFNLAVFLCIGLAGGTGLFAIVSKRERSWVAFVSVILLVVAIAFNLGPLLHG